MADFVISISYGNYLIQNGGTDKVIREHCEMFSDTGIDYIFLFPVVRTARIGSITHTFMYWGININTQFVGLYNIEGIIKYIRYLIGMGNNCLGYFVHHSWRIRHWELRKILNEVNVPIYYYLHDFYSICDGKNLINQNGCFCGYGVDRFKCDSNCIYYYGSRTNKADLLDLISYFEKRLTFVCPSDNTRDIYRATFKGHEDMFITIFHQNLEGTYIRKKLKSPIKVAFIGKQVSLKGWDDYKSLVNKLATSDDYEFYYLGTGADGHENMKVARVSVREQGQDAMMNTLRELDIDVVLLLSLGPETYSYTYFESYAAGCFIITYKCSGNIADMVEKVGNGIVLPNVIELIKFFEKGTIREELYSFRNMNPFAPLRLLPNNEIVSIVKKTKSYRQLDIKKHPKPPKRILADYIYRAQNGSKLNAIKRKL